MNLYIDNLKSNNNVYIHLLDNNKKEIKKELVSFQMEIDENLYKFCYFSSLEKKSEIIIISSNLSLIELKEEEDKINAFLGVYNESDYGKVETFILEDSKNLFFRADKKKKIHVLLPKGYSKEEKYGVIIMFDAQNLFSIDKVGKYTELNDPYGGWQIDASLASLDKNNYIVVGIENADKYREIELTPSTRVVNFKSILYELNEEGLLHGELDSFGDFINETLFPYIEKNYSVNLNEVGIAGSSCGGLASFYLGIKDYKKYKFIFTFTPATGFIEDETLKDIYQKIDFKNKEDLPYLFYYQGNKGELEHLLFEVNKNFILLLLESSYKEDLIESYIEETADHNEIMWRYGFNYAIKKYLDFKER